jgi:hypothetical protein
MSSSYKEQRTLPQKKQYCPALQSLLEEQVGAVEEQLPHRLLSSM